MFGSAVRDVRINRPGKSAEVLDDLRRLIILGNLTPGAPLVELELAQHYGCSQGPVREALLALQVEGLVLRQGHRGTRVSDCTEDEAVEMFRLRHGIETRGIRRSYGRLTEGCLEDLRALVRAMEACALDGDEYGLSEHDRAFHQRLFQAAGLPAVEPILMRCILHNHRFKITRSGERRNLRETARRHWTVIEKLQGTNSSAAEKAVAHHVATIVDFGPAMFDAATTRQEEPDVNQDLDTAPIPEMARLMARLAEEDAGLPDTMTLSANDARQLAERTNTRWNRDLPQLAHVEDIALPADPDLETPPLAARLFQPDGARGLVVYLHGGGWASCSLGTHERAMRVLALDTGMSVLGVDYRLAPDHPFPLPLHDCVAGWRAARALPETVIRGGPIAVAGDSAGANLALALMLFEQAEGRPLPDGALLFYGVYGHSPDTASQRAFGDGRFGLSSAKMRRYLDWYAPASAMHCNPLVAPLEASDGQLRDLPPLYLNAAGLDPLLSDTLMLAGRLDALARKDVVTIHHGVVHGFMQMTSALAEARAAHRRAGEFCRSVLLANTQGG